MGIDLSPGTLLSKKSQELDATPYLICALSMSISMFLEYIPTIDALFRPIPYPKHVITYPSLVIKP